MEWDKFKYNVTINFVMSSFSNSGVDVSNEFYGWNCLTDEAIMLYATLHFSNKRWNPIDLLLKRINKLDGFEGMDIQGIYETCAKHVGGCEDCGRKLAYCCGNLSDRVKAFERHVEEHLGDIEKTILFFELRRNLLKTHVNFGDPNGLFRYLDLYFFSLKDFQPTGRYEEHIKNCGDCQIYKKIGHSAELWQFAITIQGLNRES